MNAVRVFLILSVCTLSRQAIAQERSTQLKPAVTNFAAHNVSKNAGKHSFGLGSILFMASDNIDVPQLAFTLNYLYYLDQKNRLKGIFGITGGLYFNSASTIPDVGREGETYYGFVDSPVYFLMGGYERALTSGNVTAFVAVQGGAFFPEYPTGYIEMEEGAWFGAMFQVGVNFENEYITMKPSLGYLVSTSKEFRAFVNSRSVGGDFFRKYGNPVSVKLNSTIIMLELNVRF